MAKDYYSILNINRNATDDEIKKAYRKLAIKYHPDKNKSKAAEERFKEIAEAYELLTDRKKRNIYDQLGACDINDCRNQKGGIFAYHFHGDPRATFAQFFGAANPFGAFYTTRKSSHTFETSYAKVNENEKSAPTTTPTSTPTPTMKATTTTTTAGFAMPSAMPTQTPTQTQTQSPTPPPRSTYSTTSKTTNSTRPPPTQHSKPQTLRQDPPVEYDLHVSLEDIESGCTKKMRILRMVLEENGEKRKEEKVLNIHVKRGWKEGTRITFQGEGDRSPGIIPADIVFIIRDKPHSLFQRVGNDIRYKAVISLKRALCGTLIKVPTLQGDSITIDTHDEIIAPNTVKRFPGRGLPFHKEPSRRGDLIVEIIVQFPRTVQDVNREMLNDALPD